MHTCHIFLFAAIQSHFMCRKKCRGNAQFIFKSVPGMQEQKRLSFLPLFLTIAALLLVLFCQEWIKSYISDFQCYQLIMMGRKNHFIEHQTNSNIIFGTSKQTRMCSSICDRTRTLFFGLERSNVQLQT